MGVMYTCVDVLSKVDTVVAFQWNKNSWKTQMNWITEFLVQSLSHKDQSESAVAMKHNNDYVLLTKNNFFNT